MDYHPVTKRITDLLSGRGVWFETFEHEPVRTSEDAARVRPEYSLHQGAKALIVKYAAAQKDASQKEKKFAMLVFPADLKFDAKKVKAFLATRDLSFATEEEVASLTEGIQLGGVPPFGNLFGLEVIADAALFENEKIIFNAGDRCFSVAMRAADYQTLVGPRVEQFAVPR